MRHDCVRGGCRHRRPKKTEVAPHQLWLGTYLRSMEYSYSNGGKQVDNHQVGTYLPCPACPLKGSPKRKRTDRGAPPGARRSRPANWGPVFIILANLTGARNSNSWLTWQRGHSALFVSLPSDLQCLLFQVFWDSSIDFFPIPPPILVSRYTIPSLWSCGWIRGLHLPHVPDRLKFVPHASNFGVLTDETHRPRPARETRTLRRTPSRRKPLRQNEGRRHDASAEDALAEDRGYHLRGLLPLLLLLALWCGAVQWR